MVKGRKGKTVLRTGIWTRTVRGLNAWPLDGVSQLRVVTGGRLPHIAELGQRPGTGFLVPASGSQLSGRARLPGRPAFRIRAALAVWVSVGGRQSRNMCLPFEIPHGRFLARLPGVPNTPAALSLQPLPGDERASCPVLGPAPWLGRRAALGPQTLCAEPPTPGRSPGCARGPLPQPASQRSTG